MPKTVSLTTYDLTAITLDLVNARVIADYTLTSADGTVRQPGQKVWWKTLPTPDPAAGSNPTNWYQLPAGSTTALGTIINYVKSRIQAELDG